MGGTIVIDNAAGRAQRRKPAAVQVRNVLDCAGGFRSGDTVYITFRAVDGGQYVIATGVVLCDEASLRELRNVPEALVVHEQAVQLLWP